MGSKCSKCTGKPNMSKSVNSYLPDLSNHLESSLKESIMHISLDDSLLTIEKIINKCPNNPEVLLKLACHLFDKNLFSQSLDIIEKVIKEGHALDLKASIVYCKLKINAKNLGDAKSFLLKTLEQFPDSDQLLYLLAEIYSQESNLSYSHKYIKKALRINPDNAEYHNVYGLALMKEKKYEKALRHFKKAYELDSDMAKALNNAGNAYRKIGNIAEAVKCYNAAIDLVPKRRFPIALINLATTCFYAGDMISTLNYFEEALQTGSSIHKIMVKKGYHLLFKSPKTKTAVELLHMQDYSKSALMFEEILKQDPSNPVVCYYMAVALAKLAKISESNEYFKAVIEHGQKPIFVTMQFVKHYVKRASKVLNKVVSKREFAEIPEADEDSENSTINIGTLEVFKVRAESLVVPYQPRSRDSPTDSPLDTSVEEEAERCIIV